MTLVVSFLDVVQPLSWAMTSPSFQSFVTILTGWVFAPRRTLSAMLVVAGVAGSRHHAAYYRFFSAARWSLDQLGLVVFPMIVPLLGSEVVKITLDDTLARKRGLKVFGVGMHHDPLLSTRKQAVLSWGHSWVTLAVVVRLPFCANRAFSLPILFRLYLNHPAAARARRAYRARTELGAELLHVLCTKHPARRFHAFADSTYAGATVLGTLPSNCDLTSRLPLDARLHEAPPQRKPGQRGRPCKRGARVPSPKQMLGAKARRATAEIYGRKDRVRLVDAVAHWYGVPERPLRIVVVEPLTGGRPIQAFYSTRCEQSAEEVLTEYSARWSIEEAFQGSKSHLGFEEPQGWSREAVLRTAPMAMLLYSLIVVWFSRVGHSQYRALVRPWYRHKTQPSFADMLRTLRQESLLATIAAKVGRAEVPQNLADALVSAATAAA